MAAMQTGHGELVQIMLGPDAAGEIACPPALVPAPGQYLMAAPVSEPAAALAIPLFAAGYAPRGFIAAPPLPSAWLPGLSLTLRGPLGKGFILPPAAARIALAALGNGVGRVMPLVRPALSQGAAVLLLSDHAPDLLPHEVELSLHGGDLLRWHSLLAEAAAWSDYLAVDVPREALADVAIRGAGGQALVRTALPCGGLADCGACAIHIRRRYVLACKDGPVLELKDFF